ncbi:MAG: HTH-type transcriptional regulator RutR [Rhodothalassiaceae bacterium]
MSASERTALPTAGEEGKKTRIQAINEARILDAAQEIFAAYGFHGATIDRIAERAEMSKPNLHYYFKRKTDLYIAALRRTLEIWLAPLSELDPEGDPAEELRGYIREKVEMARKAPIASRVFANEILQGAPFLKRYLETDLREMVEKKTTVFRRWTEEGKLRPIDPYHLLFLLWAATQHYADFQPQVLAVMRQSRMTRKDFERVADSLCDIVLNGILPGRP